MTIEHQSPPATKKDQNATGSQVPHGRPKFLLPIILIVLLVGIGWAVVSYINRPQLPKNIIEASGRIEGYETNVGAKIGGRVETVTHREGEAVQANELIAQISDADIQAQLRGAEARIEKAQEQEESAKFKVQMVENQIAESTLKVDQSQEDSVGRIRQWEATVAVNEAKLSQSQSELVQAESDLELAKIRKGRYDFLASKQAVTRDDADQASTTFENDKAIVAARRAAVAATEKELKAVTGQLAQAKSSRLNPHIEGAAKLALQKQLLQAQHDLKQSAHEIANAKADRDQVKANIAYLKILSPISGIVTARAVEPGAVVVPGQTILSLINLDIVYLRAYIPEGQIGKIRVGQAAEVYLDANPKKPFPGKVIQIDPQGSFTPENIYFKNDRVKQVFGIKIGINQPGGYAKPGMPADAHIKLD